MDPIFFLVVSVIITITVSALCSLMEASLYAVPHSYVRMLEDKGLKSGKILSQFKSDIGKPIAAILILNTLANTGGASIAGWAAAQVLSKVWVVVFSILFVLSILYISEIFPKTIGVVYAKNIARLAAYPLSILVRLMAPIIYITQGFTELLNDGKEQEVVSEEEVKSLAALGAAEGALEHFEGSVIANVLQLDELLVRDILTPRVVVFRSCAETSLGEVRDEIADWSFSRVPLYEPERPDDLKSYVIQRDIYRELMQEGVVLSKPISTLERTLETVPELLRVDKLLLRMFKNKEHICAVVDEHGGLAGIVTLEDVIEEIVGREIVDEYDTISDLRTYAKISSLIKGKRRDLE